VLRKDLKLKAPRGETPTHWIAMASIRSRRGDQMAVRESIDFLVTEEAPVARRRVCALERGPWIST